MTAAVYWWSTVLQALRTVTALVDAVDTMTFAVASRLDIDEELYFMNSSQVSAAMAKMIPKAVSGKEIAYENKVVMKLPEDFSPRTKRDVHDENTPMLVKVFL